MNNKTNQVCLKSSNEAKERAYVHTAWPRTQTLLWVEKLTESREGSRTEGWLMAHAGYMHFSLANTYNNG